MTMRVDGGLYPALGRFFRTTQELADAGCMSRKRAFDCLRGDKDFTRQEKQAIANAIIAKAASHEIEESVEGFLEARQDFDKYFKKGV